MGFSPGYQLHTTKISWDKELLLVNVRDGRLRHLLNNDLCWQQREKFMLLEVNYRELELRNKKFIQVSHCFRVNLFSLEQMGLAPSTNLYTHFALL